VTARRTVGRNVCLCIAAHLENSLIRRIIVCLRFRVDSAAGLSLVATCTPNNAVGADPLPGRLRKERLVNALISRPKDAKAAGGWLSLRLSLLYKISKNGVGRTGFERLVHAEHAGRRGLRQATSIR
jgi:hypothetical protein